MNPDIPDRGKLNFECIEHQHGLDAGQKHALAVLPRFISLC